MRVFHQQGSFEKWTDIFHEQTSDTGVRKLNRASHYEKVNYVKSFTLSEATFLWLDPICPTMISQPVCGCALASFLPDPTY